jgi:hypothetical protein
LVTVAFPGPKGRIGHPDLTQNIGQNRIARRLARAEQTMRVRIARDELRRLRELGLGPYELATGAMLYVER